MSSRQRGVNARTHLTRRVLDHGVGRVHPIAHRRVGRATSVLHIVGVARDTGSKSSEASPLCIFDLPVSSRLGLLDGSPAADSLSILEPNIPFEVEALRGLSIASVCYYYEYV